MSGIVGIWNLDGQPVTPELLARLSAPLAHRGPDGEGRWISGAVGLACQQFRITPESAHETQPLVDEAGCAIVFDGRLDNREELLARIGEGAHDAQDASDPALLLAAYRAAGDQMPAWLTGDFAFALYDRPHRRLLIARDALGVRPLHYCRVRDAFLVASEMKALLAYPGLRPAPNDDFLADFLLDRIYDTRLTFFSGIFSVPPAHVGLLTPAGFSTRQYWDFDLRARVRLRSYPDYVEAFRDRFAQAVRRRLRSSHPVAVAISGGVDSSAVLCMAEHLRRSGASSCPGLIPVSSVAPAGTPSDEQAFLGDIERRYALSIHRVPMTSLTIPKRPYPEIWHAEAPFLDELWGPTGTALDTMARCGARSMITGHWGDQCLFSQTYLVDLVRRFRWLQAWSHLQEFARWLTDVEPRWFHQRFLKDLVKYHLPPAVIPLLRRARRTADGPWYTDTFRRRARQRIRTRPVLRRSSATLHAHALYEQATAGYHAFCLEWNNKISAKHGLEIAFPFLDRDLISFMMSIPGEVHAWRGAPKALLRDAMAGLAPEAVLGRRWKADFTRMVNEAMAREYGYLLDCLEGGGQAKAFGYVSAQGLTDGLSSLRSRLNGSTATAAWLLSDLLGLELWLQIFCGPTPRPDPAARAEPAAAAA